MANQSIFPRVSPDERGGSRSSRTRGGMRWTRKLRLTSATDADGEDVWSRHPDAGVKFPREAKLLWGMTVASKQPGHRGERVIIRKPLRRESRMPPLNLYARVRFFTRAFCTRDRGCSAHPAFPAPSSFEGEAIPLRVRRSLTKLGRIAPRECGSLFAL